LNSSFFEQRVSDHHHGYIPDNDDLRYWAAPITRPLMRAKLGLGLCFLKIGQRDYARREFHQLVSHLNEHDHQAIRINYVEACFLNGKQSLPELQNVLEEFGCKFCSNIGC
jgi:hypothetical protein